MQLNLLAESLFADARFTTSRESVLVEPVAVTVAELGLADGGTFDAIVVRAAERGLALCPLELAPHLRLALLDQPEGALGQPATRHRAPPGSLTVASAPLCDDEESARGFYLRRIEGVLWLRGYTSPSEHVWSGDDVFAFRRTPSLVHGLPITTPSLRIRHLAVEEAARMMELNGEESTRRWLPSHVHADTNEAVSRMGYLVSCYSTPGDPRRGPYVLGVEHLESGTLLGHVGFSPFDGDVEVSYAIAEDSRGRGYGVESLLRSCQWAAEQFQLPRILAITEAANEPSRRTLDRAGFVHEADTVMPFQGSPQTVSRYLWHPAVRS